jgi:hypothetical protein
LFSVLEENDTRKMIEGFQKTQNSQTLLVAVKGLDNKALEEIKEIENELSALPLVTLKKSAMNDTLLSHLKSYKLLMCEVNETKLSTLDVSKALQSIYDDMTSSFSPVIIDTIDPFYILLSPKSVDIQMKNGHARLGEYGYISYFTLHSKSLDEHKNVYSDIHKVMINKIDSHFFSPLFYYVENSQAIHADVQNIIYIAFAVLILLYFIILRDSSLLLHTFTTLGTSAMLSTVFLTQMYEQVSIFVFVFGISISTIAIDYMFHHYLHGYYTEDKKEKRKFNREVLFGFLTTFLAFFILSFTSFLLIKQIAFFTMASLFISYIHFSVLYPMIGFKIVNVDKKKETKLFCSISPKFFLMISLGLIFFSSMYLHFDVNLKNLDYDNKSLKKKEYFFKSQNASYQKVSFVIKSNTINDLITRSREIVNKVPTAYIKVSSLMNKSLYIKNKKIFMHAKVLKTELKKEAKRLGFKKEYFRDAYAVEKEFISYTEEQIKKYGLEIMKINDYYITFGMVDKKYYDEVLQYDFIKSLSMKEHFELHMKKSIQGLGSLGILVILLIILILFIIAGNKIVYAIVFLLFPIAMMSSYAFFFSINILHLFMLFIILAIGIDYAIYMVTANDMRTKKAIVYSLVSTFAGFGVLVFSQINALYSLGVIALIGIGAISMLLLCMKEG